MGDKEFDYGAYNNRTIAELQRKLAVMVQQAVEEGYIYWAFKQCFPKHHTDALYRLPEKAVAALIRGEMIEAVKAVRQRYPLAGLKEAKDLVDAARESQGTFCTACNGTGKVVYHVPQVFYKESDEDY